MKFLAVLLLCCIVFLSAVTAIVKPVQFSADKTCCQRIAGKKTCHKKAGKQDDCGKSGCATLLTCNICGFLTEQPLSINAGYMSFKPKPVSLYKIGALTAYHEADWKPPKNC